MDDHGLTDVPPLEGEPAPFLRHPPAHLDVGLPAWRLVLHLAWPSLVQQLLMFAVSVFDTWLAGAWQQVAPDEQIKSQAAQTTAAYLAWFLQSFTYLVSVGATALVARMVGAGDRKSAVHAANQAVVLAAVLGAAGGAVGYFGLPSILWALGLRGETAEFAAAYLRPMFVLLPLQMIEAAGIASLVGAGDTRTGMVVLGGMALVNMPLTVGFFSLMGFPGIGLGTACAHALGGAAVLGLLANGRAGLRLDPGQLRPDPGLIWRILWVSVPAGFDSLTLTCGHLWFLSFVNALGDADKAAHGIAIRWESLSFLSGAAFGTAASALVGQHLGGRRPDRAARSSWTAFALGGGVMAFMGAVFFAFAPQMFRFFCPLPEQAPIVAAGVPVLQLVALAQPFLAMTIIFTAALRGAGDTRVPVLYTAFGMFALRLPLAYVLTFDHLDLGPLGVWPGCNFGLLGAWMAMFVDLLVRGMLVLGRFAGGRWQRMRV